MDSLPAFARAMDELPGALGEARTILDCIAEAVIVFDRDGRVRSRNAAYERLTSGGELVLLSADAAPLSVAEDPAARALGGRETKDVELGVARGDGQVSWVLVNGRPLRDGAGAIAGAVVSFVDITERRRREQQLRDSEHRFRAILDASPVPMALNDASLRITFLNRAFVSTFGWDSTDLQTLADWWPRAYPDEQYRREVADRWQARLDVSLQSGRPFESMEVVIRCKDGGSRTALAAMSAIPGVADGTHLVILYDITDRKQAELDRERLHRDLLQAQKLESIGRLAGGVAHDFNNMLGVILGHADLLLLTVPEASPIHPDLEAIRQAAWRSADLTRQLLAFARKQSVAPCVLDLNDTVAGLLNMIRRLIGEGISLEFKPSPGPCRAHLDPSQLDQILVNLCVNARDAMRGEGRLTVETGRASVDDAQADAMTSEAAPGEYVTLTVSDDGEGMDPATQAQIFEPFFTTKGLGHGTGLGLATVYGIVRQNRGFILVDSAPSRGATFRVFLPRTEEPTAAAVPPRLRQAGGAGTVLLVEDEPALLRSSQHVLARLGYEVLAADTPDEALRIAAEHRGAIALLVTDVIMPRMNGRALASQLRALRPGLPVLFVSGYSADVLGESLEERSAFLQKPFGAGQLAAAAAAAIEQGEPPAPLDRRP